MRMLRSERAFFVRLRPLGGDSTHREKPMPEGSGRGRVFRGQEDSYTGGVVRSPA